MHTNITHRNAQDRLDNELRLSLSERLDRLNLKGQIRDEYIEDIVELCEKLEKSGVDSNGIEVCVNQCIQAITAAHDGQPKSVHDYKQLVGTSMARIEREAISAIGERLSRHEIDEGNDATKLFYEMTEAGRNQMRSRMHQTGKSGRTPPKVKHIF